MGIPARFSIRPSFSNLILVVSMVTLLSGLYGSILNKTGLGIIVYALYLLFFLFTFPHIMTSKYKEADLWVLLLIVVIYLSAIVSIFYSPSSYFVKKLINLSVSVFAFFAAKYFADKSSISKVFRIWLIIATIMNLVILFVLWKVHFNDWHYSRYLNGIMPKYLISEIYSYPPCLYFIMKGNVKERMATGFIILIQIFLGGRGPLIFFVFILLAIIIHIKSLKTLYIVASATALILIVGIYFNIFSSLIGRLELLNNMSTESVRISQYQQAISGIIHHPVLGSGFNSSGILLGAHHDDELTYPHNILLESWFESGILMFLSLLILIIYFFANFFYYTVYKKDDIRLYVLGVVCYYILNGLKSNSYVDLRLMFFFMGIFVFLAKRNNNKNLEASEVSENTIKA